jgi:hypothetical protein
VPPVQGPEEARLLEVGPALLGAERVAVAAVVAEVLEDRELVALAHLEAAPGRGDRLPSRDPVALEVPAQRLGLVGEVGVVGAGGQALVAVDAVEQLEVRVDLLGRLPVGPGAIARVRRRPLDDRAGVEAGGGLDEARVEVGPTLSLEDAQQVQRLRREGGEEAFGERLGADDGLDGLFASSLGLHYVVAEPRDAQAAHLLLEAGEVAGEPAVASRPQEVGADGDRHQAQGHAVREVAAVDPRRERDRQLGPRLPKPLEEVQREHVQRLPGQVHDLLAGREEIPVVPYHEGVRELDGEGATPGSGRLGQAVHRLEGLGPLEVLFEVLLPGLDLGVAQRVVEEAVHGVAAQEGRVQLDRDMQVHLVEEEAPDRLDLVCRATVKRRQGDLVGEGRPEIEVAPASQVPGDLLAQRLDVGPGVPDGLHPRANRRRADALEVVAHAHVEDGLVSRGRGDGSEGLRLPEHVDEHRALHVLAEALLEAQLLAPLDVVDHVGGVDAGAGDREAVVGLDRLELEDARPRQPGEGDVLGHLGLGSRGRAERVGRPVSVEDDRAVEILRAPPEAPPGEIEDLALGLELAGDTAQQALKRRGDELRDPPPFLALW